MKNMLQYTAKQLIEMSFMKIFPWLIRNCYLNPFGLKLQKGSATALHPKLDLHSLQHRRIQPT